MAGDARARPRLFEVAAFEKNPRYCGYYNRGVPHFPKTEAERIAAFQERLIKEGWAQEHIRFDPKRDRFVVSYSDRRGGAVSARGVTIPTTDGPARVYPIGEDWMWEEVGPARSCRALSSALSAKGHKSRR